jgi:hypothetical protein
MSHIIRVILFGGLAIVAFPAIAGAQYSPWGGNAQMYQPPMMGRYPGGVSPYNLFYMSLDARAGRVSPTLPLFSSGSFSLGANYMTGRPVAGVPFTVTGLPQGFFPYASLPGANYSPNSSWSWTSPGYTPLPSYSSSYGSLATPGYMSGASYSSSYGASEASGYMSGSYSSGGRNSAYSDAQREASVAALRSNPKAVKDAISDQWAYDVLGKTPAAAGGAKTPAAAALAGALRVTTEREVSSGEDLNHLLAAVVIAEEKSAKGRSAYLPPQTLSDIRFAGPVGETLNLLRRSSRLPFPAAFDTPDLRGPREAIERDFSAVAAPLLAGKPLDAGKLANLEATLKRTEAVAPGIIREQSFEDAITARRFLNQLASTVRTLKAGGVTGLVNPVWATEGTNVADLVKHMTKYKLQFGPAAEGDEPSYLALHRALSTYLFVLMQPKK